MKNILKNLLFILIFVSVVTAKEYTVNSPGKKLELKISVTDAISYSVMRNGKIILSPSKISMKLSDGKILGLNPKLKKADSKTVKEILTPVVKQKYASILDNYEELTLTFEGKYSLIFRAYDDGAAYRFQTNFPSEITIQSEQTEFNFDKDYKILFPEEKSFMSHSERTYLPVSLSEVTSKRFCSLPALVLLDNDVKAVITEADLEDYCGMYLTGTDKDSKSLAGLFPAYPAKDTVKNDRDIYVVERKDYLAKTNGTRKFPWRVVVVSEKDGDLIESTMIYKLAKASDPQMDFSWVKPGKVAWDWWNFNNIYGVDFKAGVNNNTYKYYIDFASKYGIEYVILDEGWYKLGNLLELNPEINVEELVRYGKEKNVGIILWVVWKTLDNQLEALDQFVKWGVKGIKVDFMQRDDQPIVNYYYKIAHEAAKRKLLVDFHGAYKPTGLYRTYPNVITNEGVKGLENSKWGEEANPWMAVTLPFTRMLAGPMDYTPGAMINATKQSFRSIWQNPMSQGTRCHQLAMYVNFESPLQMLADNPTNYYKEPECMEFLSKVPVVWDDTKVLDAKISEYILTARRNGNNWYIGAMTNWTPRDLTIDFSFLPEGNYKIEIWQDGINADRNANDYKKISQTINKNTKLDIHLAPGGGWVGILSAE
ncbi:MAG: glycoside hydrolase family 97 protein [Ignavibacteriales bacterium]|nr:glycoside hydrolase family 97 protein [Ignavibacteriales bacterium]